MSWQDIVISVGTIAISLSLIATIKDPQKPPLTTSLTIGTILAIFVISFASAGFWFTALVNVVTSTLWFTLAIQRMRQKGQPKTSTDTPLR